METLFRGDARGGESAAGGNTSSAEGTAALGARASAGTDASASTDASAADHDGSHRTTAASELEAADAHAGEGAGAADPDYRFLERSLELFEDVELRRRNAFNMNRIAFVFRFVDRDQAPALLRPLVDEESAVEEEEEVSGVICELHSTSDQVALSASSIEHELKLRRYSTALFLFR